MTPNEYRQWLLEQIQPLTEWSEPEVELNILEDAADIVREAGEIALRLGLPELYKATRVASPMLAVEVAKDDLGRCLSACNELIERYPVWAAAGQEDAETNGTVNAIEDERPQLRFIHERAYREYKMAEGALGGCVDKQAYKWLTNHGSDDLPAFTTWSRYVRIVRRHYNDQKNHPRAGRTGASIVKWDEIEYARDDHA